MVVSPVDGGALRGTGLPCSSSWTAHRACQGPQADGLRTAVTAHAAVARRTEIGDQRGPGRPLLCPPGARGRALWPFLQRTRILFVGAPPAKGCTSASGPPGVRCQRVHWGDTNVQSMMPPRGKPWANADSGTFYRVPDQSSSKLPRSPLLPRKPGKLSPYRGASGAVTAKRMQGPDWDLGTEKGLSVQAKPT